MRCAGCHGLEGTGNKQAGGANAARDVTNAAWQADHSNEEIRASIGHGLPGTRMHGFGALDAWIRSLRRR